MEGFWQYGFPAICTLIGGTISAVLTYIQTKKKYSNGALQKEKEEKQKLIDKNWRLRIRIKELEYQQKFCKTICPLIKIKERYHGRA